MSDPAELNVRAWKIGGFQTTRGFAGGPKGELLSGVVGLTLRFEDLDKPGFFIMTADEAEEIGRALIETARLAREESA